MATLKSVPSPVTTRMPPTGSLLNGQNQPISITQPAIRTGNTRN